MTWLTEPRSYSTLATFLAMRPMKSASAAYVEAVSGRKWRPRALRSARSGRCGRSAVRAGRVERDVEVDQAVAVGLQVDALPRGVGGQQHPDRFLGRIRGELGADVLAVLRGRRSLDDGQHGRRSPAGPGPLQPVDRVGVLGEDHHPFVGPVLAVGPAHRVQEGDQGSSRESGRLS